MPSTNIQGIYAATVTPRRLGEQDINLGVMWELIDFLVERGVDGIVLLGSTGEFVHFSNSERMRVMGLAPKRSKVPVLVNVSHSNLDGAVELAQAAQASGAAGVLLMPPYFFRYSQQELERFYRSFAQEAALEIPMLLYNIPVFANPLLIDTMDRLLNDGIAQGVKDSSGDWNTFHRLLDRKTQIPLILLVGNDLLLAKAKKHGATGAISGVAAAVPELIVALDKAVAADAPNSDQLAERLGEFIGQIDRMAAPIGVREAVTARGFKLGHHAVGQDKAVGEFRDWFQDWLPQVLQECRGA